MPAGSARSEIQVSLAPEKYSARILSHEIKSALWRSGHNRTQADTTGHFGRRRLLNSFMGIERSFLLGVGGEGPGSGDEEEQGGAGQEGPAVLGRVFLEVDEPGPAEGEARGHHPGD